VARSKTGLLACHPRKNQRGFALLLVFLMAALVAITLYMELPRLAMQAQRDKEQTLIDRGEQYKRAIQLFVAKAKRYPGDIKELESFQNQRFLRHRYEDPMTGKDEWRLIHIQNGILTDSKLTKPAGPGGDKPPSGPNGFVGETAGLGATQNPLPGGAASQRDRRRASESANGTMPGPAVPGADLSGGQNSGTPGLPGQTPDNGQLPPGTQTATNGQPGQLPAPQGFPGQQGLPGQGTIPGQPVMPGMQPGRPGMPGIPGGMMPTNPANNTTTASGNSFVGGGGAYVGGGGAYVGGGSVTGSQPANPGQTGYPGQQPGMYPGQTLPGQPGAPVNSQGGGVSPYPTQAGSNGTPPGFPQPGTTSGQPNAAADMIRNILTTPRPGGMPQGIPGAQTIGGGIAGVATTAEGEGVKVYNDRSLYQEWEFIFDPAKQKRLPNPNATGAGGTPAGSMNQGTQPATTTPGASPSQFGPQPSSPMGRPPGQ
jgi:type II secretory pathway pseudopilin PulG